MSFLSLLFSSDLQSLNQLPFSIHDHNPHTHATAHSHGSLSIAVSSTSAQLHFVNRSIQLYVDFTSLLTIFKIKFSGIKVCTLGLASVFSSFLLVTREIHGSYYFGIFGLVRNSLHHILVDISSIALIDTHPCHFFTFSAQKWWPNLGSMDYFQHCRIYSAFQLNFHWMNLAAIRLVKVLILFDKFFFSINWLFC